MPDLQSLCEAGQSHLMRMDYLGAIRLLEQAEQLAWDGQDWDTLSRLYMPLQEARRQRRIRCGEGIVCLDLLARSPADPPVAAAVLRQFPHGQLLVAGWGSIAPAAELRKVADEQGLFLETFLAASYPVGSALAVVVVAMEDVSLPPPTPRNTIDELIPLLPPHSLVLHENQLPRGARHGTAQTYAEVMDLWEKLHAPFLATADQTPDPVARMQAYRKSIRVDPACELAHQNLSRTARQRDRDLHRASRPE